MRILLLSAYDAQSHQYWRKGLLRAFPDYEWTVLTLPARYFSWRIRGNSLSWAFERRACLEKTYDLIIATSMVDLSSLRGFVPQLAPVPTIVYFHENQFAYPAGIEVTKPAVEPQIVNLYTALCADTLLFNSAYNRSSFLSGVNLLLKKLPDCIPAGLLEKLENSKVLPVPLDDCLFEKTELPKQQGKELNLVWNHRWEYDKGPDRLLALVKRLVAQDVPFNLSVVGQRFRSIPAAMDQLKLFMESECPGRLRHWGYLNDKSEYYQVLSESDVVISTALHDFQGIAMLEAVALGCTPLVPDRLAYTEVFAESYRYSSTPDDIDAEAAAMVASITNLIEQKSSGHLPAIDMSRYSWSTLSESYRKILTTTVV